jgi:hypothetical protein
MKKVSAIVSCTSACASYAAFMKTLTIRLPDDLAAEIEHESRARSVSKADVTTNPDFKIYRRHSRQVVPCLMP